MISHAPHSSNHPSLTNSTPGPGRPKKRQKTQSNAGSPFNGTTTKGPTSDSQHHHHSGLDLDSPSASVSTAGSPYNNGHSRVASISAPSIAGVNGSIHTEKPVTKRACNECRQQKVFFPLHDNQSDSNRTGI